MCLQDNCEGLAIEHRLKEVADCVHRLAGAKIVDKLETHLHFKVPTEAEARLSTLFAYLELRCDLMTFAAKDIMPEICRFYTTGSSIFAANCYAHFAMCMKSVRSFAALLVVALLTQQRCCCPAMQSAAMSAV